MIHLLTKTKRLGKEPNGSSPNLMQMLDSLRYFFTLERAVLEFLKDSGVDVGRHQGGYIPAEHRDFLDQAGT